MAMKTGAVLLQLLGRCKGAPRGPVLAELQSSRNLGTCTGSSCTGAALTLCLHTHQSSHPAAATVLSGAAQELSFTAA